jgi:YD repeat-containing protein
MADLRTYKPTIAKPVMNNTAFQHASKHFDFVLGMDFHWTVTPLNWIPLPLPHPFVGVIFDVMDYIQFTITLPSFVEKIGLPTSIPMGGSVMIFGRHKATTTTSVMGIAIPFQHLTGMFPVYLIVDKPMAPNEGEVYYGSTTVTVQGSEMSGNQPQHVLTCWSPPMGLTPLPTMPNKIKKNPLAYFAFYSRFLKMYVQINTGGPVLIGGTFMPHNYTIGEYLMRFAGMAIMRALTKALGKSLSKGLKTLNNKVLKNFKATNKLSAKLCKHGFEPVNFVTGEMSFEWEDFTLQGSTLLSCKHSWQSQTPMPNMFGNGVFSNVDTGLLPDDDASFLVWKHPNELIPVHIPYMEVGEAPFYYRPQKIWIARTNKNTFTILHEQTTYTYTFFNDAAMGNMYRIQKIEHADGMQWQFTYHKGLHNIVHTISDGAGRQLIAKPHENKKNVGSIFFSYKDLLEPLVSYHYDERGNLTHVYDSQQKAIQFNYNKHNLVVERINRNGMAYWWQYDSERRVTETSGSNGFQHGQIVYHTEEGYNEIIYPQTPDKIEKIYYTPEGLIEFEVDALGGETWYDYTPHQERSMVASPEGRTIGYEYDEWGNISVLHKTDGERIVYEVTLRATPYCK